MRISTLAAAVAALSAIACTYQKTQGDTTHAAANVVLAGDAVAAAEIRLERTACFHSCPEYSVSVAADGVVRYNGLRHVAQLGVHTARIQADSAALLFRYAADARFDSLAGEYVQGTRGCDPYIADLPGVIITVVRSSGGVRVEGDPGCPSIPPALVNLATMIDHVAGAERWTVKK